ncbi:hypothetical protein [Paenibacillus polymyxa]|uniref:hypothetical protein n=1 Tax=Paenibacillus polymyxa TaxID=1406 RepID=UPI001D0274FD|nr:hypothetical protein [Paenibacillus polymyxa]
MLVHTHMVTLFVPTGTGEYDQLAIKLHADGSLTESEGFTIPAHIAKVVKELQ